MTNSDPKANTYLTSSDEVLVQLKIQEDFELKGSSTFQSDLNQNNVLTDHEMIMFKHEKGTNIYGKLLYDHITWASR